MTATFQTPAAPTLSPFEAQARLLAAIDAGQEEFTHEGFVYSDGAAWGGIEVCAERADELDGDAFFPTGEPGDPITKDAVWVR